MNGADPDALSGFTNERIDVGNLPRLDGQPFEPLDPAYVRVRTLVALAVAGVVLVATAIATIVSASVRPLIAGSAVLALVIAIGVVHRIEVARMGYLVRDHDLSFRRGVIGRSVATVPFARVQHVTIERGPVDRRFGLASVQLRTAGGSVSIPGLAESRAERLKQLVADRAGQLADGELDHDTLR